MASCGPPRIAETAALDELRAPMDNLVRAVLEDGGDKSITATRQLVAVYIAVAARR